MNDKQKKYPVITIQKFEAVQEDFINNLETHGEEICFILEPEPFYRL